MRRFLGVMVLALAVMPFAGCSKGQECDTCTVDEDCENDLVCRNFLDGDGNVVDTRCGSGRGVSTCRVR
jgi:hypothetical protein